MARINQQPAATKLNVSITEGAKTGAAQGGNNKDRKKSHRGDEKKRQAKGGRSSQARGVIETAVREAVDQASGAKIAAGEFKQEMKDLRTENSELKKKSERLEELEKGMAADVLVHQESLKKGFDLKIRWRPGFWGWKLLFWTLAYLLELFACIAGLVSGLMVYVAQYMILYAVEFGRPGPQGLFFWVSIWLSIRIARFCSNHFERPGMLSVYFRAVRVLLLDYSHEITPADLCWWEWRARRLKFDGVFAAVTSTDLRPDANSLQQLRHKDPLYARVKITKRWGFNREVTIFVSMELVAQLTSPRFVSGSSTIKDLQERMWRAAETYPFVNLDRYLTLDRKFVANDSVRVALALLEYERERSVVGFLAPPVDV